MHSYNYPTYPNNFQCSAYTYCCYRNSSCPGFLHRNNSSYRNEEPAVSNGVILEEQTLAPAKFKLAYPVVTSGTNGEAEAIINSEIVEEVSELFKRQVLLPEKTEFEVVDGFYDVKLNEKEILSILFGMYTYVNGAAHGFTAYSSITLDTQTGKVYNFEDLFNPSIYYKGYLDEIAKKYIKDNQITLISEYHGITEDQQFYLTPDSLVLYYQIYEYTPYAYGIFEIKIPFEQIKNLLSPTSPI